jgi:hypothetical protein
MAKTMTASVQSITDGQIDNVVAKLRDALRKHRGEFGSEAAQQVLGVENLGMELLAPFRKRVEAIADMIVRRVKVDRSRSPQEMLAANGRAQYVDKDVVKTMPKGEGDEVEVFFFKVGRYVNVADLAKEYELRGLKPDHYAQDAVNAADPAFADDHPNGTQWQDAKGNYCYLTFGRWRDGRRSVGCDRGGRDWRDVWWFAGVRK